MATVCILPASVRQNKPSVIACIVAGFEDCFSTVHNMHMWCTYDRPLGFLPKLTLVFSSGSQSAAALRRADQKWPDSGDSANIRGHCTLFV